MVFDTKLANGGECVLHAYRRTHGKSPFDRNSVSRILICDQDGTKRQTKIVMCNLSVHTALSLRNFSDGRREDKKVFVGMCIIRILLIQLRVWFFINILTGCYSQPTDFLNHLNLSHLEFGS